MLVRFAMLNILEIQLFLSKKPRIRLDLEPPDLIQISAILAHDLKKLQEDVKKHNKLEQLDVNGCEECDKELPKTEIMQQSLEKQLDT